MTVSSQPHDRLAEAADDAEQPHDGEQDTEPVTGSQVPGTGHEGADGDSVGDDGPGALVLPAAPEQDQARAEPDAVAVIQGEQLAAAAPLVVHGAGLRGEPAVEATSVQPVEQVEVLCRPRPGARAE